MLRGMPRQWRECLEGVFTELLRSTNSIGGGIINSLDVGAGTLFTADTSEADSAINYMQSLLPVPFAGGGVTGGSIGPQGPQGNPGNNGVSIPGDWDCCGDEPWWATPGPLTSGGSGYVSISPGTGLYSSPNPITGTGSVGI